MKESVVQRRMMDRLEEEFPDIYIRKIHQTAYSHKGIHDLMGCLEGDFFTIEVKSDGGKPTPLQLNEAKCVLRAGGRVYYCIGIADIEGIVDDLRIYWDGSNSTATSDNRFHIKE